MFAKLIADSLAVWTTDYKIDGFRFDLMGYHPKAQILSAWERIKALNPDIYFFGEGWDSNQSDRFEIASQINRKGTGIGTFSDRLRDAVRGGGPVDDGQRLRVRDPGGVARHGPGVMPAAARSAGVLRLPKRTPARCTRTMSDPACSRRGA